ncbi:hypothetical protein M8C21_028464 [Ambrosia artemisiifolia]|uniref:Uncharacterized protein n=1 Tax=Ambrosia artemisiifolia TaxID=4212 RepID=A0AAD5CLU5_AMBAR|nr:hypothetical protein M8C21_028464 [Ambrosia artemisiifolia]
MIWAANIVVALGQVSHGSCASKRIDPINSQMKSGPTQDSMEGEAWTGESNNDDCANASSRSHD